MLVAAMARWKDDFEELARGTAALDPCARHRLVEEDGARGVPLDTGAASPSCARARLEVSMPTASRSATRIGTGLCIYPPVNAAADLRRRDAVLLIRGRPASSTRGNRAAVNSA